MAACNGLRLCNSVWRPSSASGISLGGRLAHCLDARDVSYLFALDFFALDWTRPGFSGRKTGFCEAGITHEKWYNPGGVELAPKEQPMQPDQSNQSEPFPRERVPPEIMEWARQTFDEEEFLTQVRENEATGDLPLEDFIAELEARARNN
ncbi:MAG TPA: hypothetical protein VNX28_13715 [Gemmataceae bacterium]|nr:hypothetical protein [Gemmataceae bacterium]